MSESGAFFLPEGDDRFVTTELGRRRRPAIRSATSAI